MKKIRLYARLLAGSIMMVMLPVNASAQENSTVVTRKSDVTALQENESPHSLFTGIGYSNNMIYMGSNISQDKPVYSGFITYGYKNELFASVSINHLTAFDPFLVFSTISLSYSHDFNSWLDISFSASSYQVNSKLTDTLFNNFFYGSLAAGFDWEILYTNISVSGIFSEASNAYFQLKNSKYFTTPKIMNGKVYFSFDPYVTLLFGTLTKTITADGTSIGVSPPFKTGKPSGGGGGGSNPGTTSTFFSLMEVDLGVPVALNTGKLTVEAEPGYILPTYSDTGIQSPKGFTLFLNISYRIF
ncbi:MAG: hypothetical protein MUC93_00135 [Bacteroidales bacterium]|jgi:hypothetical protein|nr:hypothetical protein [Bacteroidales bacterium]